MSNILTIKAPTTSGINTLKKLNKIQSTKLVYKILDLELKNYIHSIQILII